MTLRYRFEDPNGYTSDRIRARLADAEHERLASQSPAKLASSHLGGRRL